MSNRTLTLREIIKAKIGPVKPLEEYPLPRAKPVKAGGNYETVEIESNVRIPVSRLYRMG
jgi:hypothetical protein